MIINSDKLEVLNNEIIKRESFSYLETLKIFEELYREAVTLGVFNDKNIFDGLDASIRIASTLNGKNITESEIQKIIQQFTDDGRRTTECGI